MTEPRALADVLDGLLAEDDAERARRYPGTVVRQPVHTVYVPADRFTATTVPDWGAQALAALDEFGPLPGFAGAFGGVGDVGAVDVGAVGVDAVGVDAVDVDDLHDAVRAKLARDPIEDLRIDFEDGYGHHDDEDDRVRAAAIAVRAAAVKGDLPAAYGLRIKSFEGATRRRGLRTLELFLDAVLADGPLPPGFRVTLPKVTSVRQVEAMTVVCDALEAKHAVSGSERLRLRFELQIETSQAVLGADGVALVAPMLHAADGRCIGLHYGTYDYSTALGVGPAGQSMEHPVADHATSVMQVAAAGTGAVVSHGSTNVLPVGTPAEVHAAWELHARLVRRSLERGIYQGWDLHPAQLPTRYAATFAFYRDGLAAAGARLRTYLAGSASGVLDEPATARSLAGFLLRAVRCGAVSEDLAVRHSGLDVAGLERLA